MPEVQKPGNGVKIALKTLIALLLLGAVLVATLVKAEADYMLGYAPEYRERYWPLLLLAWACLMCGAVFLIALWQLVNRVYASAIFQAASFRYVALLFYSAVGAAACCLIAIPGIPGPPVLVFAVAALGGIFGTLALTVSVLKYLLQQAVADHEELEGVI